MAASLCARHHGPFRGKTAGAYPALLLDGRRVSRYLKFCSNCLQECLLAHQHDWRDAQLTFLGGDQDGLASCHSCGQVTPETCRFYATVYVGGKDRRDFTAEYCNNCAIKIAEEFDLAI